MPSGGSPFSRCLTATTRGRPRARPAAAGAFPRWRPSRARRGASIRFKEGKAMAPSTASTITRLGRVLHRFAPTRHGLAAAAAIEVAVSLLGLPLPLHLLVAVAGHAALAFALACRPSGGAPRD